MKIENVQRCTDTGEMSLVEVPSHSDPDTIYEVLVIDINEEPIDVICECEGFLFRGHCSHQQEAVDAVCAWHELEGPEVQDEQQRADMECPRCGNMTEWVMEATDDE